jgi:hypothetical protein
MAPRILTFVAAFAALAILVSGLRTSLSDGRMTKRSGDGTLVTAGRFANGAPYRVTAWREGTLGGHTLYVQVFFGKGGAGGDFPLGRIRGIPLVLGAVGECTESRREQFLLVVLVRGSAWREIVAVGSDGKQQEMLVRRLPRSLRIRGWTLVYAPLQWTPRRAVAGSRGGVVIAPASFVASRGCTPGSSETVSSM